MNTQRQTCTRCVMDTSDPDIRFDAAGVCHHCHAYDRQVTARVRSGPQGRAQLEQHVERIRKEGRNREYDCLVGVSGGVDSTYVAYAVKELGLRPLALHLDNGWDSELAVKNIEHVLNHCGIPLHTTVLDWDEFRDLQVAFLKSSTPDSEIPTDHAIMACLFAAMRRHHTPYVMMGWNSRTESHHPQAWSRGHFDWGYIRAIHRQFGTRPLKTFPHLDFRTFLRFPEASASWINVLDYLDYSKTEAMKVLQTKLGWQYYGGKHYESIYTRFYQGYILPRKFGFDKRRCHLASLVCSGEWSRDQAVAELAKPPYDAALQEKDLTYVVKKLALTPEAFQDIMNAPPRSFWDYPSYDRFLRSRTYRAARFIYRTLRPRRTTGTTTPPPA